MRSRNSSQAGNLRVQARGDPQKRRWKKKEISRVDGVEDGSLSELELELPNDVVASIQARLSLVSLQRSRAVCREWNRAVASPWLLQERLELRENVRESMLVVIAYEKSFPFPMITSPVFCMYDPASNRWYQLELPPCFKNLGIRRWTEPLRSGLRFPAEGVELELPAKSMGGGMLMSLVSFKEGLDFIERKIIPYIGNPVANSWACLPALPDDLEIKHVRGVFVDAMARSFKLVAVQETPYYHINFPTYVFDSAQGSWTETTSTLPVEERFKEDTYQGAFVGTVLYCIAGNVNGDIEGNLLAYDLERANWRWLAVAKPRQVDIYTCNLINVQDRLLCAAWCWGDVDPSVQGWYLEIWELDFSVMAWKVVPSGAMPKRMFTPFRERGYGLTVVAGQDSQVYFMHDHVDKIAAFNLRQTPRAWRWLPTFPFNFNEYGVKIPQCVDPWLEFGSWK